MNARLGAADDTKDETGGYPLGYSAAEARRLEVQGKYLEDLTADVFRRAGITPGMHILDIGCGVGDVSLLAAQMGNAIRYRFAFSHKCRKISGKDFSGHYRIRDGWCDLPATVMVMRVANDLDDARAAGNGGIMDARALRGEVRTLPG